MDKKNETLKQEYYTVDLLHIAKSLWQRVWVIILVGLIAGGLAFSYAAFAIAPTYSSSIMLYVNNSSFSLGNTNFSITASEITAAQSLVNTYAEILNNRTTLERVIEKADVSYNYTQLYRMIEAAPSNETEIMRVTVTAEDPFEAAKIANCIAEVLPVRISEIIEGASMEVVDSAVPNVNKVAPSITRYTAVGLVLGVLGATLVLVIVALRDDSIHDEDYVLRTYDYPILAKIPDLVGGGGRRYGRYGSYYQYQYYKKPKAGREEKK